MMSHFMPVVAAEVFDLRPDYSAVSVIANGIDNLAHHPAVDRYVEDTVAQKVQPPWTEGHLEAWRTTFRAFGAKPQRTPCSADALLMRLSKDGRLPTINAVVDLYNAISIRYAIPIGGENIAAYVGSPRLMRASGAQAFDTMKEGESLTETVPAGEVVWADTCGVTCRRWNWRQGVRTRIDVQTRQAWFVLERLEPMSLAATMEAASSLMETLRLMSPGVELSARLTDRSGTTDIS
jgi:DNA/RNA-binding domain of Phe-tRNA-synthetase-like protein